MTIQTIASTVLTVFTTLAQDLTALHGGLSNVLTTLPIEASEKASIQGTLDSVINTVTTLQTAASALGDIANNPAAPASQVVIDEADVEKAVSNVISEGGLVAAAVASYLAKNTGGQTLAPQS